MKPAPASSPAVRPTPAAPDAPPRPVLDPEVPTIAAWNAASANLLRLRGRLASLDNRELPDARERLAAARRDPLRLAALAGDYVVGAPPPPADLPPIAGLEAEVARLEAEREKVHAAIGAQEKANIGIRVAASVTASQQAIAAHRTAMRDYLDALRAAERARVRALAIWQEFERFDLRPCEPMRNVHQRPLGPETDGNSDLARLVRELRDNGYLPKNA